MMRKLAGALALVVFLGAAVAQQDKGKDKDKAKDAPKKTDGKEVKGKVLKVDVEKKTISVELEDKKKADFVTDADTKFIGPRGGKGDGLKDDRLDPGYEITILLDKKNEKKVLEVHLAMRKREDGKDAKKDDAKAKDKAKDDAKAKDAKKDDAKDKAKDAKKDDTKKPAEKKDDAKKATDKKSGDK